MSHENEWFSEVEYDTWGEFKDSIVDALNDGFDGTPMSAIWFRGQGDAEWPLVASFDRAFGSLTSSDKAKVYDKMITSFRERSALEPGLSELEHDDIICVMQHFGAPTRVLDWTVSPYIAAYFAFANASSIGKDQDDVERCAVWMLHANRDTFRGFHTLKLIDLPPLHNPRAWSQHGRFTLNLSSAADMTEELRRIHENPSERPSGWIVRKVTLPRSEASVALRDLELMGLSSESLFPGLEGIARYAFFRALDDADLLD